MISFQYLINRFLKKIRLSALRECTIHPTSKVESGTTAIGTSIGRHSFTGYDCTLINCNIGAFSSIASKVTIGGARHPMEYVSTSPVFLSHKDSVKTKLSKHVYEWKEVTVIGNDVWIGEGVMIKGGVKIGDGAVVGMGSIVTKNIPPYAIYAGNPARLVRFRFNEATIIGLLKMRWWDRSDDEIRDLAPLFKNPESMLKKAGLL